MTASVTELLDWSTMRHCEGCLVAMRTFTLRAVSVPCVWNSFIRGLCSVSTLGLFQSKLKTTLFLAAYGGNN